MDQSATLGRNDLRDSASGQPQYQDLTVGVFFQGSAIQTIMKHYRSALLKRSENKYNLSNGQNRRVILRSVSLPVYEGDFNVTHGILKTPQQVSLTSSGM